MKNMHTQELKIDLLVYEVPEHERHKSTILNLIDQIPNNPYEDINKTDWNLPPNFEKKYLQYFHNQISPYVMVEQQKYFNAQKWEITAAWFQQYGENSGHLHHTHPKTNLANVYFVELPDPNFKTSILIKGKEYEYQVKEGQIITFPAHLLHCSKTNKSGRKTVIAFNSEMYY